MAAECANPKWCHLVRDSAATKDSVLAVPYTSTHSTKRKVMANDTEHNLLLWHREIKLRSGTGQRYSSLVADEQLLDPVIRRLTKLVGDQRCRRTTVASKLLRNKQTHDHHQTDVTNNRPRVSLGFQCLRQLIEPHASRHVRMRTNWCTGRQRLRRSVATRRRYVDP